MKAMKALWLRDYRKRRNLTQEELAAKLQLEGVNVGAGAISHWENGRYFVPLDHLDVRLALAKILRVDVETMLKAAGYEVGTQSQSDIAKRAAYIIENLAPDKQRLALGMLEQIMEMG